MARHGADALVDCVHPRDLGGKAGVEVGIRVLVRDAELEVGEDLLGGDVAEEGLELRGGGRVGGGSGSRRRAVEVELIVDVLIVDLDRSGARLDRALDDREVGLDLLNGRGILYSEDGGETLAGEGSGVDGVDGTLWELGDGEDLGLREVEVAAVAAGVEVEHRHVERGLGDERHADLGLVRTRAVEAARRRGGWRGRAGQDGLGLEGLVARELLEEGREGAVAQEALDEDPGAGVLLHERVVLRAELVALVDLAGNLALELADVFCGGQRVAR